MANKVLYTIFENHVAPNLAGVCERLALEEITLSSVRRAIGQLKKKLPDVVIAEFKYGYSNNYSGIHISNLDVFLMSLKPLAPDTKIIVVAEKDELQYVEKLAEILPIHGKLAFPIQAQDLDTLLERATAP